VDTKTVITDILTELTGTDAVESQPDINLFDEGLLDSIGTVEMLVLIEEKLGLAIPPSEFDRELWATPNMIVSQVEKLLS
jgi:D-alanine--poly(phosphoribitol) ligase subunit 2